MTVETKNHNNQKDLFYPYGRLVIVPTGLIVLVILFILGLILYGFQMLQAGGLNEHSPCSQYTQASETAQNAVISTMLTNHGQNSGPTFVDVERISVNAYCAGSPDQPIDGVLNQNP